MSVAWTITGEAGKALDATSRTLEAMGVEDLHCRFDSGKVGSMSWRIALPNADGTGIIAPEIRQKVTLWRNAARYFQGHVIRRRPIFNGDQWSMMIEVADVLWWMDQIPLTSVQADQAGNNATRMAFVFGTGDLNASFAALFARSIALGVPMAAGTIATMFDIPRVTVTGGSTADAVLDLQRWVPDAMFNVDYSPATPTLNVYRRKTGLAAGSAPTRTITLGVDGVEDIDLQPRIELEVTRVVTDYASRDVQGRGIYQTAANGLAATGQTQIVVVSGPESIDLTLPQDLFDSVVVQSALILSGGKPTLALFEKYDQRIKSAGATGLLKIGPPPSITYNNITYTIPSVTPKAEKEEGGVLSGTMTRYLTQGEVKDWWERDGIPFQKARAQATMYWEEISPWSNQMPPGVTINSWTPTLPEWVQALGMQDSGGALEGGGPGGSIRKRAWYYYTSAVTFPAVSTNWAVATTLYRQEDYSFVNPPAGLAGNLLACQNFIPYEGAVEIAHEDVPAGNPVGTCVNIANGPAELVGIRGMVQAAEMDIQNGIERLTIGASPRLAYEDLVRRFRRTGFDNFDFVSNPLTPAP